MGWLSAFLGYIGLKEQRWDHGEERLSKSTQTFIFKPVKVPGFAQGKYRLQTSEPVHD